MALASIIIAGLDTTVHLIGNGVAALAANPDQLASLIEDPVGRAPAPSRRSCATTHRCASSSAAPTTAGPIVVLYGSANRDERVFEEPDAFRIDRDASAHLAFGSGIHLCLGAPLARLEGTSLFRALAERVGSIEVLPGADAPTRPRSAASPPSRSASPPADPSRSVNAYVRHPVVGVHRTGIATVGCFSIGHVQ